MARIMIMSKLGLGGSSMENQDRHGKNGNKHNGLKEKVGEDNLTGWFWEAGVRVVLQGMEYAEADVCVVKESP